MWSAAQAPASKSLHHNGLYTQTASQKSTFLPQVASCQILCNSNKDIKVSWLDMEDLKTKDKGVPVSLCPEDADVTLPFMGHRGDISPLMAHA